MPMSLVVIVHPQLEVFFEGKVEQIVPSGNGNLIVNLAKIVRVSNLTLFADFFALPSGLDSIDRVYWRFAFLGSPSDDKVKYFFTDLAGNSIDPDSHGNVIVTDAECYSVAARYYGEIYICRHRLDCMWDKNTIMLISDCVDLQVVGHLQKVATLVATIQALRTQ